MSVARVGILADDLTGALDASAPFPARGLATFVSIGTNAPPAASKNYRVLALNMDSRRKTDRGAISQAIKASRTLTSCGFTPVLNKVDSTLRGHTGVEANAALGTLDGEILLVAPAFPGAERTVVDGHLLVRGIPVDQTDVGKDPLTPIPASSVVEVLRSNTGMEVASIRLSDIRSSPTKLANTIEKVVVSGACAIVLDSESDSDLQQIVKAAVLCKRKLLLAGSGGLAASLAVAYGADERSDPRETGPVAAEPFLVVAGSQREIVPDQIEILRRHAHSNVVRIDTDRLLDSIEGAAERERAIGEARRSMAEGRSSVLWLSNSESNLMSRGAQLLSVARERLVAELAATTVSTVRRANGLVLIGGDTSQAVLEALGANGVILNSEPLPGIPAGTIHGGEMDGAPVVTKAGAFGDQETLLHIFEYLTTGKRRH